MKITCTNCKKEIFLDTKILNFISNAQKNNRDFIMLHCDKCGLDFGYNPKNENSDFKKELVWRCPISGCHGHVSFVEDFEDKPFYGCSETGTVWYEKEDFYKDIEKIIQKYPHRKNCYENRDNEWLPKACDIEDLIDTEEDE